MCTNRIPINEQELNTHIRQNFQCLSADNYYCIENIFSPSSTIGTVTKTAMPMLTDLCFLPL